jgi:hypothetical protein
MRYFKQCYIFAALEIHHQMVDNQFVVDSFLEACQNPKFQGNLDDFSNRGGGYFLLLCFISWSKLWWKKLIQAIVYSKWLLSILESNAMIHEKISLFWKNYRPKGSKSQISCFYSAPKGSKLSDIDAPVKWTTNINDGKDLLSKKLLEDPH